jgi:hypothetical protein
MTEPPSGGEAREKDRLGKPIERGEGDKMKPLLLALALLALIGLLAGKGLLVAPPAVPTEASVGFDAGRAAARLQRILGDQQPHPVDTAAGDAVRARLVAELTGMGLAPRITDDWACNGAQKSRSLSCARVHNVVATVGPATGRSVLVASHYDSTPAGPGAADDGIGTAAALEIAFLLKDRPLARPVAFLFDEGEEAGLLGAKAFLEHDPIAARIDSAINMEARGVDGPAIMFETSRPNGGAVSVLRAAADRPVANSMTADFYRLIPKSTDVTVFASRPWTMLNFAVIGNETRYHSPGDRLERLDPRSLAHMGRQALAATERLAQEGPPAAGGERLYADILGRTLLVLPSSLGLALFGLIAVAFVGLAWVRRGGIARGSAAVVAALVGSGVLVLALQVLVGLARPGMFWRGHPGVIAFAVDLTSLAAAAAALAWIGRGPARDRLRAAFWLVFMLLSLAIVCVAPGAAIFSLLPPLAMLCGAALDRRLPGSETVGATLAWVLLFLTWAPLVHLSEVLLDFGLAALFAPFAALLCLPPLIELRPLAGGSRRPAGLLAIAASGAWAAVALAPAYTADRKQNFRIEYGWDAAAQKGSWFLATDGAPLPSAFPERAAFRKGVKVPWSLSRRLVAPAPAVPLPPPALTKLSEVQTRAAQRLLGLRIASGGADQILLRAEPDSGLVSAAVGGSAARFQKGGKDEPFFIRCAGRSCDGATLQLVAPMRPLTLTVIAIRFGLPAEAAALVRGRPANAQAQYSPDSSFAWTRVRL